MPELTMAEYEREKDAKMSRTWDSFLPFYSQWYWDTNWLGKKYKAWYNGPRIEWMKLVKEKKNVSRERSKK